MFVAFRSKSVDVLLLLLVLLFFRCVRICSAKWFCVFALHTPVLYFWLGWLCIYERRFGISMPMVFLYRHFCLFVFIKIFFQIVSFFISSCARMQRLKLQEIMIHSSSWHRSNGSVCLPVRFTFGCYQLELVFIPFAACVFLPFAQWSFHIICCIYCVNVRFDLFTKKKIRITIIAQKAPALSRSIYRSRVTSLFNMSPQGNHVHINTQAGRYAFASDHLQITFIHFNQLLGRFFSFKIPLLSFVFFSCTKAEPPHPKLFFPTMKKKKRQKRRKKPQDEKMKKKKKEQ